jgi:hypothetical protein
VEQMIGIIGWLGGERRAERERNRERSHRAPNSFSIALGSAFTSASVARIVAVGVPFRHLVAAIVLRGSTTVNFFEQATVARCLRP